MTSRDTLLQSIITPGPTNPFAVSYLQLCQVSYLLPMSQIPAAVAALPPLNPGGSWQCAWGPATNSDESNLAFVATYYYGPGLPVFAAVVLRGTDFYVDDGWGVVEQIWEDLDVPNQVPLPWAAANPARIANGTLDGLTEIQQMTSGGQSMLSYLTGYLGNAANNNPVLIVTGHSLGGCLTTVVAPWLKFALAQNNVNVPIVPCSFAAPTAGNAAFAAYFNNKFSYSLRYYNTLDVVPFGWANLPGVDSIYDNYGLTIPDSVYLAVGGFELMMRVAQVTYTQPVPSSALPGVFLIGQTWTGELAHQHHTTTYMQLLGGTSVTAGATATGHSVRTQKHSLRDRFGPMNALLAKVHVD